MENRLGNLGQQTISKVLEAFFPHACLECGLGERILCAACRLKIGEHNGIISSGPVGSLDGLFSMALYSNATLHNLLHEFKYEGIIEAGDVLKDVFEKWLMSRRDSLNPLFLNSLVIPMPMHWYRRNLRGFNQSLVFAKVFADVFSLKLNDNILHRRFKLKRQAEISNVAERKIHASGSVFIRKPSSIGSPLSKGGWGDLRQQSAILIDDVTTTGATLEDCAQVLKSLGFKAVYGVTLLKG